MPLSQHDPTLDYDGSWGDASKGWPELSFPTEEEAKKAYVVAWRDAKVPYGSYVLVGTVLRLETQELKNLVIKTLAELKYPQQKESPVAQKKYVVMFNSDGDLRAEILERDVFIARITPKPGGTDAYYGGDYGVTFVDSFIELKLGEDKQPMRLLVFEVGEPVKPKKVETVVRYDLP